MASSLQVSLKRVPHLSLLYFKSTCTNGYPRGLLCHPFCTLLSTRGPGKPLNTNCVELPSLSCTDCPHSRSLDLKNSLPWRCIIQTKNGSVTVITSKITALRQSHLNPLSTKWSVNPNPVQYLKIIHELWTLFPTAKQGRIDLPTRLIGKSIE